MVIRIVKNAVCCQRGNTISRLANNKRIDNGIVNTGKSKGERFLVWEILLIALFSLRIPK